MHIKSVGRLVLLSVGLLFAAACTTFSEDGGFGIVQHTAEAELGQHEEGLSHLRIGISLNENSALGFQIYGMLLAFSDEPDRALELLERAVSLSPRDPNRALWVASMGVASFAQGNYDKGVRYRREAISIDPTFTAAYQGLSANLSALGRMKEARATLEQLESLQPGWTVARVVESVTFANEDLCDRYVAALAKAGMPVE